MVSLSSTEKDSIATTRDYFMVLKTEANFDQKQNIFVNKHVIYQDFANFM